MMKTKQFFLTTLFILAALMTSAQEKLFTLEDLNFGGRNFHNLRPQNMFLTWWGEQLMYQDVEEGGTIDLKGKQKKLFTLEDIGGAEIRTAQYASYPYPAETLVLLKGKSQRLLYDWKKKQTVWQQDCSGEQNSHWNSQSRAVAYTKDHQLYVRNANNEEKQLTTDGSREIVYGEAVHRHEFGITEGLFWSPDGQRLAFYRMDQSMVTDYPQVNIYPRVAEYEPDKYPMAGMKAHVVTVGVYDLTTDKIVYLETPAPAEGLDKICYFTNIAWSPDSKQVFMFELNRDQNDCLLKSYDALTGHYLKTLYREQSSKYVEPQQPILFLPWDASLFIMQSQKDGYNHLYLYNTQGQEQAQLTKGEWVVLDVLGFNTKTKSVIIASNEQHPLQRNLYAVDVKTGKRTLLDNGEGVHRAKLSAGGSMLYDKWTSPSIPQNIDAINTANAKSTRLLTAEDPWKDFQQPGYLSGSIKAADGVTDLYYRMVVPKELYNQLATDESNNKTPLLSGEVGGKRYPTVVYVYGGPHAHNVEASWHWYSRTWETYMAQKGYVLFILDNRGSENRGRDFEQATFRQLGQIEMQDQMKGVEFLKSLPYVDTNRMGIHGWSFGGFMTISLMLNYPDVFKVGVAGGPVIDWKWYEVMYGERYMDTPQQNPEGYEKTSLINKAGNLKGKLQIITGYNDNTVVPQHCLSFLDACVKAGTQPDFFAYPGEEHNMRGHASVHLHERITQYFEDYLK
ncbi:MAG: DPP IV N-terminal domain-containing protein [Prevotella sp.]|nr:DPP IV N-terminal domain-containing protein [Prevotella sp.]